MKAVVFHGIGQISLDEVENPKIVQPNDAIVRLTMSSICGTDLHMVRGTISGMQPGTILGHEGMGVIEEVGSEVRNFNPGDRVIIPSTVGCGYCAYCRAGYFSQCDNANPNGPEAGTCFFGGPKMTGPLNGLQAELARVPFANVGLVRVPDFIEDEQAIILSDIFPTGYFGASLAEIKSSDTVAVFGCGPVGLCAIASAFLLDAGRVLAIDHIESRLELAKDFGAETINFDKEDPIKAIKALTGGIGVDRAIDAVGVDAVAPQEGPASEEAQKKEKEFRKELKHVAPKADSERDLWRAGDAPSIVLRWSVESLAKAGTLSIIGVYPPNFETFPLGTFMGKNLTINSGSCNHRKYIPLLMDYLVDDVLGLAKIVTQIEPFTNVIDAYETFDRRRAGFIKYGLEVSD